jgi:tRNA(Ile)-lysidine synthase
MNWVRVAGSLALALTRERLHPAVLRWAAESGPKERWAVALSGGADSVALLLLLWAHFPERRERLLCLHYDHRLRGRASAGDARFCAGLCRSLGVALVAGRREGAPGGALSEAESRAKRIQFFTTTLRRRRVGALFTGHHRDDLAETILMRLARGSGAAGLAAPRPVHAQAALGRVHLRPLLDLEKAVLLAALRTAGARWREDASNTSSAHLRNRVRSGLLPAWRSLAAEPGRDALAGLALSRELLEEDEVALEAWAVQVYRIDRAGGLLLRPLRELPRAVLRRVLRRWLEEGPGPVSLNRRGFNALLDHLEAGRTGARLSLAAGLRARLTKARLIREDAAPVRAVAGRRRERESVSSGEG